MTSLIKDTVLGDVDGLVVIVILHPVHQFPNAPGHDLKPAIRVGSERLEIGFIFIIYLFYVLSDKCEVRVCGQNVT